MDGTLCRLGAVRSFDPTLVVLAAAHVFGAVSLEGSPRFHHMFATVFNGSTFFAFLKKLVRATRCKLFLIIDNGPCHNLQANGVAWLQTNRHRIELHPLPACSPNLNPIEGVWKETKECTTHNRFFKTTDERDTALRQTFVRFDTTPEMLAGQVARFL